MTGTGSGKSHWPSSGRSGSSRLRQAGCCGWCGRRLRTFNVIDDFNREVLHIEIDTSITSLRLVRIFEHLRAERGLPQVLRTDNGP